MWCESSSQAHEKCLCPEKLGKWGQSREIYQAWDTGLGATVPARKYNLEPEGTSPTVAVIFQSSLSGAG